MVGSDFASSLKTFTLRIHISHAMQQLRLDRFVVTRSPSMGSLLAVRDSSQRQHHRNGLRGASLMKRPRSNCGGGFDQLTEGSKTF